MSFADEAAIRQVSVPALTVKARSVEFKVTVFFLPLMTHSLVDFDTTTAGAPHWSRDGCWPSIARAMASTEIALRQSESALDDGIYLVVIAPKAGYFAGTSLTETRVSPSFFSARIVSGFSERLYFPALSIVMRPMFEITYFQYGFAGLSSLPSFPILLCNFCPAVSMVIT